MNELDFLSAQYKPSKALAKQCSRVPAAGDEMPVRDALWSFLERWPTALDVMRGNRKDMAEVLAPCHLPQAKVKVLKRFSGEWRQTAS